MNQRVIKFRAFNTISREWHYFTLKELTSEQDIDGAGVEWNEYENWCEWTGLLDKNGKEIFEGDVNADDNNKKSEVVFYAGGFYLNYNPTEYLHIGGTAPFDRNVIGNVFENPDLLTK